MATEAHNDTSAREGVKVYEIGYLLAPLIAEEHVPAEVSKIKSLIESHGGNFISEESPKMRPLAYAMRKAVDGARHKFDKAYFGWIKFETTPEEVLKVKVSLDANSNIVRFLLINTVRENTLIAPKPVYMEKAKEGTKEEGEAVVAETPASPEEIDRSIEELVIE